MDEQIQQSGIYQEYLNKRKPPTENPPAQPVPSEPPEPEVYQSYAEWLDAYYKKHKE